MATHDYDLANQSGAAFRGDLNDALEAIVTNNSSTSSPSPTFAQMWWADTTNNLLKQRNATNSAWLVRGTLAETFVISRSSNTILGVSDHGRMFQATSSFTQTLTAAATLGDGWYVDYINASTGNVTLDPNSSETINGAATLVLKPGQGGRIWCNGTAFRLVGLGKVYGKAADIASAATVNFDTATGDWGDVTGTTTITAITLAEGRDFTARFTGALTITNGASLVNITGADIITEAGDWAQFRGYSGGVVRMIAYQRANGQQVSARLRTAVATTSGSSIDFTGIPAGVKRITVMLNGVSTAGTSLPCLQLGNSGGIENSGYTGAVSQTVGGSTASAAMNSAGFNLPTWAAASVAIGKFVLTRFDSTKWICEGHFGLTNIAANFYISGLKELSGELDRVRLTTVGGSDAFDLGSATIFYE